MCNKGANYDNQWPSAVSLFVQCCTIRTQHAFINPSSHMHTSKGWSSPKVFFFVFHPHMCWERTNHGLWSQSIESSCDSSVSWHYKTTFSNLLSFSCFRFCLLEGGSPLKGYWAPGWRDQHTWFSHLWHQQNTITKQASHGKWQPSYHHDLFNRAVMWGIKDHYRRRSTALVPSHLSWW